MGERKRGARKKLEGAARYWLGVDQPVAVALVVDDSAAQSMRAFGASEENIAQVTAQRGESAVPVVDLDYWVHADCWDSVMFFLKVETQWMFTSVGIPTPMGAVIKPVRTGLNRACVESEMRMRCIKPKRQAALLDDLKVIEVAVLEADAEAAAGQ